MKKNQIGTLALLLGLSGIIGFQYADALAQQVKQLKEPAAPTEIQVDEGTTDELPATTENVEENAANSSYSVVIENKMDKDGKMVQTKKVWKNGVLTEETEKVVEPGEAGDAAIELSDGEIAPGMILRSERFGELPFNGIPEEQMKAIQKHMEQIQEQMKKFENQNANIFRFDFPEATQENVPEGIPEEQPEEGSPNFQIVPNSNSQPANVKLSDYWIGAAVEPLPEIIAAQMPIDAGQGVLILRLVPDSPAEKAGLKMFDVITKIGDHEVKNVFDIGQILDQDGDKVQKVEFYRKGKLETLDLTPAKRPEESLTTPFQIVPGNGQSIKIVRPGMIISGNQEEAEENNAENNPEKENALEKETPSTQETEENASPNDSQTAQPLEEKSNTESSDTKTDAKPQL